ncbi:hypothetical protein [Paenibacillus sp. TY11]
MRKTIGHGGVLGRPKQAISDAFIMVYEEWKEGSITAVEAMKRVEM